MKLQAYQLCRWCDAILHGHRKWLWLGGGVLALALSALAGKAFFIVLSAAFLVCCVLGLYLLHRHHAFGAIYQRKPRAQDALCETVLIDAALIGQGTRLRAAAQPVDVADGLSLRLGSGMLLMGAAMTLTADELPPADRSAILSAVQQLNIKPDRMRSHNPILRRETQGALTSVTVRDGLKERRYFLGSPADVAACCTSIWENHSRPMTAHDQLRIDDTSRYIAQANCRVLAWATALDEDGPTFLGLAGIGEAVHLNALQDISALRNQGLTVMLASGDQAETDLESLRALLELPDHHARADLHLTADRAAEGSALGISCMPGESLLEPVALLRQRFHTIEDTLRHFGQMLLTALLIALLCGSGLATVFIAAMFVYAAIALGVDLTAPRLRWPTMLAACVLALIAGWFLRSQPAALTAMGSGIIAVTSACAAILRMTGKGFTLRGAGRYPAWGLTGAAGLLLLILVVYGALQGAACLLPLGFSLLISAAIGLLIMLEQKILR